MRTMISSILILYTLWGATPAISQLPPDVQADAYLLEVEQAIGDGNYDRAWDRLQDIVRLQEDHDLDLPEFHFWFARTADAMDLPEQALESVREYLTAAGRQASHYVEALALLNTLQTKVSCEGWDAEAYFETATLEQVTACLETGNVDLEAGNASGLTPLHNAATDAEDPAVIEALIAAGADLMAGTNIDGHTPLHEAASNENPAVLAALVAAGGDLTTRAENGATLLYFAARNNPNLAVIETLLEAGADVAARTENGATPLHHAAWRNPNPAVAEALIAAGADPNVQRNDGQTPLYYAASDNENPAVIEALIAAGADPNVQGNDGFTPLYYAARNNPNPAVFEALLAAGADPNVQGNDGFTPLHYAARNNENVAVIEALIAAGAKVREDDDGGRTPLHHAARYNENVAVIEALIAAGAKVREDDDNGATPLHLAARYNENPAVADALIAAGAKVEEGDDDNYTPLYYATNENPNPAVAEALRAAGADRQEADSSPGFFGAFTRGLVAGAADAAAGKDGTAAKVAQTTLGIAEAVTLDEDSVKYSASRAAAEYDKQNQVAPPSSAYSIRLSDITKGLENFDGLDLDFKVYLDDSINAFAMADGTVRVYSGLLDAMPDDDQVRAVIGHEIGHVHLRHIFTQTRQIMLNKVAFESMEAVGGTIGALTSSQLGQLAHDFINAKFSQNDELESDAHSVGVLKRLGHDPYAMQHAIETLQDKSGASDGNFLSSHPSYRRRIEDIRKEIDSE